MIPHKRLSGAILSCLCAFAQQQPASFHGRVFDSSNAQPLSKVHLRLLVPSPGEGFSAAYGAISDAQGRFSISPIPPGTYLLWPERAGFALTFPDPNRAEPFVIVKPGETREDFRVDMAPRSVLSGHVLDENGQPVRDAFVHFEPASNTDGGLEFAMEFLGTKMATVNNDRGEFRISPPPGKFVFHVQGGTSGEEIQPDGSLISRFFADTYYPGVPDRQRAKVVEVRAGQELDGLDIRVGSNRPLSISGTVAGIPPGTSAAVRVRAERSSEGVPVAAARDGSFSTGHLAPGKYSVYAESGSGPERLRSSTLDVELNGAPATGLVVLLRPLIRIAGAIQPVSGAKTVRLEPIADFITARENVRTAAVKADGSFEFTGLEPERYKLTVYPIPADAYLKRVVLDGAVAAERAVEAQLASDDEHSSLVPVLDAHNGTVNSKLNIAIGDGARISGKIDEGAISAPAGLASVTLVPDGRTLDDESLTARVGADGTYTFHALPPGRYRLVGAGLSQHRLIEVKEGDRIAVDGRPAKESGNGK